MALANRGTLARYPPVREPKHSGSPNKIDRLVFNRLKRLGISRDLCSDAVFVRRVYLDVIGTLPTARRLGISSRTRTRKNAALLIDRLLERKEFADYWAMKWCDVLRVKSEYPINLWPNAAQAYHRWIRTCIRDNMPYDRFVREMLTASGSNFQRAAGELLPGRAKPGAEAIAQAVALSFMGVRAGELAKGAVVGDGGLLLADRLQEHREWKEEIVFFDPGKGARRPTGRRQPSFPTARRSSCRRVKTLARPSPIG